MTRECESHLSVSVVTLSLSLFQNFSLEFFTNTTHFLNYKSDLLTIYIKKKERKKKNFFSNIICSGTYYCPKLHKYSHVLKQWENRGVLSHQDLDLDLDLS